MVIHQRLILTLFAWLFLVLPSCQQKYLTKETNSELLLVDQQINPDQEIELMIFEYRSQLDEEMNQVLAYSPFPMRKSSPEGLLNNFVADLVLEVADELYIPEDGEEIDFCLLNYGGLRANLPEGPITRARVFEIMPFENEMVVLTLTGEKAYELFEYVASSDRGMPISGLKIGIRNGTLGYVLIQGKEFDRNKNYKVVTSDYLAEGGDRMRFFLEPLNTEMVGMRIRDAIILYMERETASGNKLFSELDGRIYFME